MLVPGATTKFAGVTTKSPFELVTLLIIRLYVPTFDTIIESNLLVPFTTSPKFSTVGFAVNLGETPVPVTLIESFKDTSL